MARDKLWNGTLIGAIAGVTSILIPKVQDVVFGWLPESITANILYPVLIFAGAGALIGLIADRW